VRELLAALNTGHEGGCGTVHANAPADVVARFEALGALAGLGPDAIRAQLAAAIDVVVHVMRDRGGRRVASVAALFRRDGNPCIVPALEWDGPGHEPRCGPAWPALSGRLGLEAEPVRPTVRTPPALTSTPPPDPVSRPTVPAAPPIPASAAEAS
jgi:pilus assembly protein CpaF